MKKLVFILLISIFLPSCAKKLYPVERKAVTAVIDFRKYNAEGFFISSTPYVGLYDPLGKINIAVFPAKKVKPASVLSMYTDVYEKEVISYNELLEILVNEAKKLGADGLVNMSIDEENYKYISDTKNGTIKTEFLYYSLNGLAIKRK